MEFPETSKPSSEPSIFHLLLQMTSNPILLRHKIVSYVKKLPLSPFVRFKAIKAYKLLFQNNDDLRDPLSNSD